jgi:uncharacterized protein (TIGR03437 family)
MLLSLPAAAQFVPRDAAVPRTGKPPVVFVNGYQPECPPPERAGTIEQFRSTFGGAGEVFERNGQPSVFFDTCLLAGKPPIEMLARAFGEFLGRIRYQDGEPVAQVDVVAHSMGGLVVRSYLAGKQSGGGFAPPPDPPVRKVVFLGTPHFGSSLTSLSPQPDPQLDQLRPGSDFLFELATWNQGTDDLRGVDAIAVLGNAGNGLLSRARLDDSTVSLISGSLEFTPFRNRTRIVNYCHTTGLAELLCSGQEGFLAQMTSDTHLPARIALSFLNGTEDWRAIGEPPAMNTFLSRFGGLALRTRDANDRAVELRSATVQGQGSLDIRSGRTAHSEFLPNEPLQIALNAGEFTASLPAWAGSTRAITVKPGPNIAAVIPSFAAVLPRSVAPGMFVSIYGSDLAPRTEAAPGLPYPTVLGGTEVRMGGRSLPLHYASPAQINAVIPDDASGYTQLTVRSGSGEHTVNVLVEPVVPALHPAALNAVTGALITADAPLLPGEYVSLYLTGLGATERRGDLDWARVAPEVTVGGRQCQLLYAGRAPGYIGLDQINCRVAVDAAPGSAAVVVRSGRRTSNTITLLVGRP